MTEIYTGVGDEKHPRMSKICFRIVRLLVNQSKVMPEVPYFSNLLKFGYITRQKPSKV